MTSSVVPLTQHNTQLRITLERLKQCSSNLAPAMYITIEIECHYVVAMATLLAPVSL